MVSYNHKPDKLTLEQWQVELRRMQAKKDMLDIHEVNNKSYPGYYNVTNAITHKGYRVVYRGACSGWNFCSCMDFKTNQLGTCKHLEAVGQWLELRNRQPYSGNPPHTSLYLSYKGERKIYLRIGTDDTEAFRELARGYFTHDGVLREDAQLKVGLFIKKAQAINNTFRIYSDAMAYLIKSRADMTRVNSLDEVTSDQRLDSLLKTKLYPYQKEGIRFAYRAGSSIIADEMGLGKTLQAIGVAQLMKAQGLISSVLILCPTSLKYQWKKEIEKFTDDSAVVVEGTHIARKKLYQASEFYKIVSYNSLSVDIKALKSLRTDFLIMDEVQRLKNWNTQISKAARRVESDYTVVLSGTPLENKLDELYSITQFVDQYCLGPYYKFVDETTIKSETGKIVGYKNLNAVGERLKNTLIRRRRKDVALQLPPRQDETIFVPMTSEQRRLHDEYKVVVAGLVHKWARAKFLSEGDRRRLLLMLNQMRMLCDSTYVLDQESRNDTKVDEAVSIIVNHLESGIEEKVVVFSQWERMTRLISGELDKLGIGYEYLHGGVPSKARKDIVDNFTLVCLLATTLALL